MTNRRKLRISSFYWTAPALATGQLPPQAQQFHAVMDGDELVAICPEKPVAERVVEHEEQKRARDEAKNARQSGREHLS